MNYLDLFSGIGGFALGAYWAGMKFENHYFSEIDPYCVRLYQKRFPDAIALGDITKIDTHKLLKGKWIITGGFPCQDISIAGKGAGIEGKRSGLWFEMWRLIRELRPEFVIAENVGALTFRGLDRVLSSLAEIGYDAEWQDIRASDMGAPHRRERIWIVAYSCSERRQQITGSTSCHEKKDEGRTAKKNNELKCNGESNRVWNAPNSNSERLQGRTIKHRIWEKTSKRQTQILFSGQFWKDFPTKSGVCRGNDGIPHRVDRLRALGNSIVPQIAELLFNQIKQHIGGAA